MRLIRTKAAHGAAGRVVGIDGARFDIDHWHLVRTAGVTGGPLQHLAADRGVGTGVAQHARLDRCDVSLLVAAHRVIHGDRMALGVHADRLFTTQRDSHRQSAQMRKQGRLCLHRHIFLAAKSTAIGHQFDVDF